MRIRVEALSEFLAYTSAHGFAGIRRNIKLIFRIGWIICIIAAWSALTYQVRATLVTFFQYPTTVNVRISHSTTVDFPAVTICNLNPIRMKFMKHDPHLQETFLSMESQPTEEEYGNDWGELLEKHEAEGEEREDYGDEEMLKELLYYKMAMAKVNVSDAGHQLAKMMVDCQFQSRQCYPGNFTRWTHSVYGNCYTFFEKSMSYTSSTGPSYGLALTLFTQDMEYLPRISAAAGFRVEVGSPYYAPFPEDRGFTISPGVFTSVAVRLKSITRLAAPYNNNADCGKNESSIVNTGFMAEWGSLRLENGFSTGANYSNPACMKQCLVEHIMSECNCMIANSVNSDNIQNFAKRGKGGKHPEPCNPNSDTDCRFEATESMNKMNDAGDPDSCDGKCKQACHELDYSMRITGSLWPRDGYFSQMGSAWGKKTDEAAFTDADEAREQMAKIEVYFEDLNLETITEEPTYNIWSLLSNVGGTLGLYGGLSFLTCVEFVELFVRLLTRRSVEEEERRRTESNKGKTASTDKDYQF